MEMYCSNHSGTVYARCPDKCKGAAAPQCRVTEAQSSWISVKAQQEIIGFGGDALICSYCGCCYIRQGMYTRRLGMLIAGHWHSVLFPMYED